MTNRLDNLRKVMPQDVDAVLVVSSQNRYYFTGLRSSAGTLLVTRDASYFIIDFRYIELAKRTIGDSQVILQDKLETQLQELMSRHNVKRVAVETTYMTVGQRSRIAGWLEGVTVLETPQMDQAILALRARKDEKELELIQAAQQITDRCFSHILNFIKEGRTEREISLEMLRYMMEQGAEKLAFDIICVSGINSSLPHGVPTHKPVAAGDFLTMDFGAMMGGYCSDMTRTVAIGHVTEEMDRLYHTVLGAQQKAFEVIRAGEVCSKVDAAARDLIYGAGYEGCFGHGLGHSVGLDIHEDPRFSAICQDVCQAGMVMTVEPGIYLEGKFGCRIEDMVYIQEDGFLNLTNSSKELIIL